MNKYECIYLYTHSHMKIIQQNQCNRVQQRILHPEPSVHSHLCSGISTSLRTYIRSKLDMKPSRNQVTPVPRAIELISSTHLAAACIRDVCCSWLVAGAFCSRLDTVRMDEQSAACLPHKMKLGSTSSFSMCSLQPLS